MNGDAKSDDVDAASLGAPDILNPFVHRLELGSTYEKLKVSTSLEASPGNRIAPLGFGKGEGRMSAVVVVVIEGEVLASRSS